MADPLDALRAPATPAAPDPAFTAHLRARLERALALPRGVAVSTVTEAETTTVPAAIPYLAVRDARRAIDWYVEVLGAVVHGEPIVMPDGHIGHAELGIGGGVLYLSDEAPDLGAVAPSPGGSPVALVLDVADADATRARALAAGASGERTPYDGYGHRNAWIFDPFGHRWLLQSPLPASVPYRHGDIGYASLWVPDVERAAAFYGRVLGWTFSGRRVEGTVPALGLWGEQERGTLFCCYAVDDVHAAVRRVREAGGEAGEPQQEPWGLTVDCTDDQGVRFAVYEQGTGPSRDRGRHGDLGYVTYQVVDSARARAFYGAVLGWTFRPGRVTDSAQVEGRLAGISGGHEQPTVVPMWLVDDVEAAVRRVREAGGQATDPARQPYGLTAECRDDQGTPFYLGEA